MNKVKLIGTIFGMSFMFAQGSANASAEAEVTTPQPMAVEICLPWQEHCHKHITAPIPTQDELKAAEICLPWQEHCHKH